VLSPGVTEDRFLAAVARRPNERDEDAISAYQIVFRAALDRDGRMCLCACSARGGVLSARKSLRKSYPFFVVH